MTRKEHIAIHKELHKSLDELVVDMINHTTILPSETTIQELRKWSHQQIINPSNGGKHD